MSSDDDSQGASLEEDTRQANSNLQRLIDAIGGLLAASGDVLARLQQILSGAHAATSGSNGSDDPAPTPPTDPCDS